MPSPAGSGLPSRPEAGTARPRLPSATPARPNPTTPQWQPRPAMCVRPEGTTGANRTATPECVECSDTGLGGASSCRMFGASSRKPGTSMRACRHAAKRWTLPTSSTSTHLAASKFPATGCGCPPSTSVTTSTSRRPAPAGGGTCTTDSRHVSVWVSGRAKPSARPTATPWLWACSTRTSPTISASDSATDAGRKDGVHGPTPSFSQHHGTWSSYASDWRPTCSNCRQRDYSSVAARSSMLRRDLCLSQPAVTLEDGLAGQ